MSVTCVIADWSPWEKDHNPPASTEKSIRVIKQPQRMLKIKESMDREISEKLEEAYLREGIPINNTD